MCLGLAHQNESYVLRAHEIYEVSKYYNGMIEVLFNSSFQQIDLPSLFHSGFKTKITCASFVQRQWISSENMWPPSTTLSACCAYCGEEYLQWFMDEFL